MKKFLILVSLSFFSFSCFANFAGELDMDQNEAKKLFESGNIKGIETIAYDPGKYGIPSINFEFEISEITDIENFDLIVCYRRVADRDIIRALSVAANFNYPRKEYSCHLQ